jgi:hypothetical protein
MRNMSVLVAILSAQLILAQPKPASTPLDQAGSDAVRSQEASLVFPGLLKKEALEAGNPLATYAAMLELEPQYLKSGIFAQIYPEVRLNFEEFLGFPLAGLRAMQLPQLRISASSTEVWDLASYKPEAALRVIEREARKTQIVIWGEEHHLPQTRSLYEAALRALWKQGYRYLAAETFDDSVMAPEFNCPLYQSGYYLRDPIFATAVRVARELGYKLIAYDTTARGPAGDLSFRDRTQAANLKARVFDVDPAAKVFVIAGRGHASEEAAADGWTPMASVLKKLTGIDPLTLYAPTMTPRLTHEEEHPLYRLAVSRGLVEEPTIFVNKAGGTTFGTSSLDAYIFWPPVHVRDGRPDWMVKTLRRRSVPVPKRLSAGSGMRLVQAFVEGEPATAVPVDQIVLSDHETASVLMLPRGKFWLRAIDPDSRVVADMHLSVR